MRFTGDSCLLLFAYICCIATAAAHVLGSDRHLNHRWAKREVQCEDSKLVAQTTRNATYLSIITDNGDILFSVDDTNTTWEDIYVILHDTPNLALKTATNHSHLKRYNTEIFKRPIENGLNIVYVRYKVYNLLFSKEFQGSKEVQQNLYYKCAHLTGSKVMLEDGLDINHRDGYNMTLLQWATIFGDEQLVKKLVERGANVNAAFNDEAPLSMAIAIGKDSLVEYLIKHGANVNTPSNTIRTTPLHVACYYGRLKSLQILLDNGANISTGDIAGLTPLYYAFSGNQTEVIKELIGKGVDVIVIKNGDTPRKVITPLYTAILYSIDGIIPYLIKSGADVNTKFEDNYTPLIFAVSQLSWNEERTLEVVKLLVDHNADVNAMTDNGQTALQVATERKLIEVQNYLKAHGAK